MGSGLGACLTSASLDLTASALFVSVYVCPLLCLFLFVTLPVAASKSTSQPESVCLCLLSVSLSGALYFYLRLPVCVSLSPSPSRRPHLTVSGCVSVCVPVSASLSPPHSLFLSNSQFVHASVGLGLVRFADVSVCLCLSFSLWMRLCVSVFMPQRPPHRRVVSGGGRVGVGRRGHLPD